MRLFLLYLTLVYLCSCASDRSEDTSNFFSDYTFPNDVSLELIAQEPTLNAPVAIDFDQRGRIWVLEMPAYMPNIKGINEDAPVNKIKILEDTDRDGIMDKVDIFLDSLVLPRTMLLVYGGLLYAEPPFLYFVEINGSQPGKKTVVDSVYAVDGNVEHMPNSLTLNMDNWIYSTCSNARYKRKKGRWLKEYTTPRGQWGLSTDNYGRLVYNTNSLLIATDRILPNALFTNKYLKLNENNLQSIASDQRVFPLQATAVNRGYQNGVLDEEGKLINATSACGPLYYRETLNSKWNDHAFVALPEINAIKRLKIERNGFDSRAVQTDTTSEYLISVDEGFRPVHMKTGPDGNIYIVDMHRGIIQHKAYMTSYLREKILKGGLDKVSGMGRIIRLSHNELAPKNLSYEITSEPLKFLHGDNAFLRDKAQHELVYNERLEYVQELKQHLRSGKEEINLLHSLWSLEGLEALSQEDLSACLDHDFMHLRFHALDILTQWDVSKEYWLKVQIDHLISLGQANTDFTLAAHLASLGIYDNEKLYKVYSKLLIRSGNSAMVEAILADAIGKEDFFMEQLENENEPSLKLWMEQLQKVVSRKKRGDSVYYYEENLKLKDSRTEGLVHYQTYCATCHGADGEGKKDIAPPLLDSEFVSGREDRLVLISLYGLSGPFIMGGKSYSYKSVMPGIEQNDEFTDNNIKELLNFVRNAFASADYSITEDLVKEMRNYPPQGQRMYDIQMLETTLERIDYVTKRNK